ncbi:vacuolar protein sorting-associated protein 72 homolog [Phlebotomus argentipes]|uniref:vacuolar protein sorting-associated protein 72 homolog n=1 Tax=Phlebotomus argentipes TaxID=94469 RepID=UPI002892E5F7|nr:vacuolar protein sorting-associated protein 72 homolog [Phlebotomus argentipes]
MAANRERRSNAGNRIARLLDDEEEDDFYKTSYGGFQEAEDDKDYEQRDEEEDVVDSDFSIDENDEPVSDEEEEKKTRKRRGVVTKAYKEPVKKPAVAKDKKSPAKASPKKVPKPKMPPNRHPKFTVIDSGRKSFRKSTALKTAATQHRLKQLNEAKKHKKAVVKTEEWIPTQEELLEEALDTEKENIKSLEKYQKMELEKKKTRPTKRAFTGPMIRYHSMSMPLIEELTPAPMDAAAIKTEEDAGETDMSLKFKTKRKTANSRAAAKTGPRVERTFVTFENDLDNKVFESYFPQLRRKRQEHRSRICPITHLPAKYLDPVTKLPYRNLAAFKIIREGYYRQLEEKGNPENPLIAKWLQWRKQIKDQRQRYKSQKNA